LEPQTSFLLAAAALLGPFGAAGAFFACALAFGAVIATGFGAFAILGAALGALAGFGAALAGAVFFAGIRIAAGFFSTGFHTLLRAAASFGTRSGLFVGSFGVKSDHSQKHGC